MGLGKGSLRRRLTWQQLLRHHPVLDVGGEAEKDDENGSVKSLLNHCIESVLIGLRKKFKVLCFVSILMGRN